MHSLIQFYLKFINHLKQKYMNSNEQIFRILIEEGFSKGDANIFDKYASSGFIENQHGIKPSGIEGVKKAIESLHQAFSDFSLTVADLVSDGDKVWGRMIGRGTHTGQFGSMPPSNKKFEITVIDIMRFEDGKLVEHWGVPDRLALMEQISPKHSY
jgi:predicted ester cyclase